MNPRNTISMLAAVAAVGTLGLAGCQTDKHAMTGAQPGVKPVCRECYELATQYRQWYPSGLAGIRYGGSGTLARGGEYRTVVDRVHQCTECKTEVSFYTETGIQKIKCAKCAPEGLACDMCAPPK
ncbi:MAG: hypothetical protein ACKVS8_09425 [Phycisphaerales bacterium]